MGEQGGHGDERALAAIKVALSRPKPSHAPHAAEDEAASKVDTSFADAMEEAAKDGRLAAYWTHPHVFGRRGDETAPRDLAPFHAALHEAWREAARLGGTTGIMLEAIVRVVGDVVRTEDPKACGSFTDRRFVLCVTTQSLNAIVRRTRAAGSLRGETFRVGHSSR